MGQGYVSGVVNSPPTPSLEGAGLLVASEGDFAGDDLQDAFGVPQNIVVPEANQAVAVGFDDRGSNIISGAFRMLPAVAFDGEAQVAAGEVDDVITDRELSRELCAAKFSGAQMRPQMPFGIGHVAAQFARDIGQSLFRHTPYTHTQPSPSRERALVAKLS